MNVEDAILTLQHVYPKSPAFSEAVDLAIAALRARAEVEKNEPLTLDELRKMDGDPVWVVPIDSKYHKAEWGVVHLCPPPELAEPQVVRVLDGTTGFEQMIPYPKQKRKQLYGKTWLAYRYKPEECGK